MAGSCLQEESYRVIHPPEQHPDPPFWGPTPGDIVLPRAKSRKDGAERSFGTALGTLTPASPLLPEINVSGDPYLALD